MTNNTSLCYSLREIICKSRRVTLEILGVYVTIQTIVAVCQEDRHDVLLFERTLKQLLALGKINKLE